MNAPRPKALMMYLGSVGSVTSGRAYMYILMPIPVIPILSAVARSENMESIEYQLMFTLYIINAFSASFYTAPIVANTELKLKMSVMIDATTKRARVTESLVVRGTGSPRLLILFIFQFIKL